MTLGAILFLAAGCGSRPVKNDGGAGTNGGGGRGGRGAAGTTGAAGGTGTAGSTGAGGAAGVAGTTGAAGAGGASGGRGGSGGVPAPECTTASDCKLVDDCCTCAAIPVGAAAAACNDVMCKQNQCSALQRGAAAAVDCVAGRCVAGFACDATQVLCKVAAPVCPASEVPVINDAGNCYVGTCALATECKTVSGCGACTGANEACVSYETQLGVQHHCVTIPPQCDGASCACFGAATCLSPYRSCREYSGLRGVYCSCPTC